MIKRSLVLFFFLLLLEGCSFTFNKALQVEIISPEKTIYHPLHKEGIIKVSGRMSQVLIEIKGSKVHVLSSGCPDKTCIKTGWISHKSQFILCAPNAVNIRIIYLRANQVDFVTY